MRQFSIDLYVKRVKKNKIIITSPNMDFTNGLDIILRSKDEAFEFDTQDNKFLTEYIDLGRFIFEIENVVEVTLTINKIVVVISNKVDDVEFMAMYARDSIENYFTEYYKNDLADSSDSDKDFTEVQNDIEDTQRILDIVYKSSFD